MRVSSEEFYEQFLAAMAESNEQARVARQVREQMAGVSVTERSPDGAVEVTVNTSGAVLDIRFGAAAQRLLPRRLSAVVMSCVRAAQGGIEARFGHVLTGAGVEPATAQRLLAEYRARRPRRFGAEPTPVVPETRAPQTPGPDEVGFAVLQRVDGDRTTGRRATDG